MEFDMSVEPDMTRRLSEKPTMKKEDSYEYKMTDLEFDIPADEQVVADKEKEVKELEEQKSSESAAAEKAQLEVMREMLRR